jgi:hypothetical protein
LAKVWRDSDLFLDLREPEAEGACTACGMYDDCQGGCMAAKFFTGIPLSEPDPECVGGQAEQWLAAANPSTLPRATNDHSRAGAVAVQLGRLNSASTT